MTPSQSANGSPSSAWKSALFDRLKGPAERLATHRPKVWNRVGRAARLASHHRSTFGGDYGHLRALFRMLRAWSKAAYRPATTTIVSAVAVVLYILSPIDVVPDFLPVLGWLDDASFFVWFLTKIRGELDRFVTWEQSPPAEPSAR